MEAEWEEENKLDHVFKSTAARETSIERERGVGGKRSTEREETTVEEKETEKRSLL